jgi:hypothetical protein
MIAYENYCIKHISHINSNWYLRTRRLRLLSAAV